MPLAVRGSEATTLNSLGSLKRARRSAAQFGDAAASNSGFSAGTTWALPASAHFGSEIPIAAISRPAGCSAKAFSISAGWAFSPPGPTGPPAY